MGKEEFLKIIRDYGLDEDKVNRDLSAYSLHLWHNEIQGIGFGIEASFPDWEPNFRFTSLDDDLLYEGEIPLVKVDQDKLAAILNSLGAGNYKIDSQVSLGKKTLSILGDGIENTLLVTLCK